MTTYKALIVLDLRLAFREKAVIFFNYLLPLLFFIVFTGITHAGQNRAFLITLLAMALIIGIIGNGLFGAGIRVIQEREMNILRRYKITPISPAPLLIASVVTGWIMYMPNVILMFGVAHFLYAMPWPDRIGSILIFLTIAIVALRAIGLIIASVVNSMQEGQVLVQLVFIPMLFLSGATLPLSMFPPWLLVMTQFVPATYMVLGIQGMLLRNEGIGSNVQSSVALIATTIVGLFIAYKLFRWERGDKVRFSNKLWLAAVLTPFIFLGAWQVHTRNGLVKSKILSRELARSNTYLIRGARIFVGDGTVIDNGAILIRNGKIAEVFSGTGPDPGSVSAQAIDAVGKTVLPGFIDVDVHLGLSGGFSEGVSKRDPQKALLRNLAAYLYSGVTTVRSAGDDLDQLSAVRSAVNKGEFLGAQLYTCGPLFVVPAATEIQDFEQLSAANSMNSLGQAVRVPTSIGDSRQQVNELKRRRVDCISIVPNPSEQAGFDEGIFSSLAQAAHTSSLPLLVQTGDLRDIDYGVHLKANSIERGSFHESIPESTWDEIARQGIFYVPTLSWGEAMKAFAAGEKALLRRPLLRQAAPPELLGQTIQDFDSEQVKADRKVVSAFPIDMRIAIGNLKLAEERRVNLAIGSAAGSFLVVHGPTVQHELELWVRAGIPPAVALQAATLNGARMLGAEKKIGSIRPGMDADILVVDGDPLEDIAATERISLVLLKGESIDRSRLFDQK